MSMKDQPAQLPQPCLFTLVFDQNSREILLFFACFSFLHVLIWKILFSTYVNLFTVLLIFKKKIPPTLLL